MKTRIPAGVIAGLAIAVATPLTATAAPPWAPAEDLPQIGTLSSAKETSFPDLAVSSDGHVAAVWVENRGLRSAVVVGAQRSPETGAWTTKVLSKPGIIRSAPLVEVNGSGQAINCGHVKQK